jgi:formyl-CoA transferase
MTALLEREVSGEGQWVQSCLLQSQIALNDFQSARFLMKGEVPPQVGNDHPTSMPTSAYKTKDGHMNIAASGDGMWQRLCQALGRPEMLARADFTGQPNRAQNRKALNAEIERATVTQTTAEWVEILNAAGVPCGPIYNMDQVFSDPQVEHLEAAASVRHPRLGEFRIVNQAVKLTRTPASMACASPELGEHTDEILQEIGYAAADLARLRKDKVI